MAQAAKLKVFRTAIGFHDAYVAAPSRKAALAAWGSDKDLFARGAAELVTDAALSAEPLAAPGQVIKRLRGTEAEQIAALPKTTRRNAPKTAPEPAPEKPPRPSRAALDEAEQALAEADRRHGRERKTLMAREEELARERRQIEKAQRDEREGLEEARDDAAAAFDREIRRWRA